MNRRLKEAEFRADYKKYLAAYLLNHKLSMLRNIDSLLLYQKTKSKEARSGPISSLSSLPSAVSSDVTWNLMLKAN